MKRSKDTVALIATPQGEGGIGVIQVSGAQALEIVGRLFRSESAPGGVDLTKAPSGGLFYGTIHDNEGIIDEVLVSVWRAGESLTGEDLVEINCHGGIMPVRKTLEALLRAGAREGEWEELLDRAILFGSEIPTKNGGLDFIQKEVLLFLPNAKTRLAVKVLLAQYHSPTSLSQEIKRLEGEVQGLKGKMMECDTSGVATELSLLLPSLEALANSSHLGLALMNPLKVTIAGAPNVGKSTLFNALLREDRVLVHPEPGTTRDYVSEYLSIEGIPLELIDTAGLRETDGVEKIGVEWARKLHKEADRVILVLDASRPINKEETEFIKTLVNYEAETSEKVATQVASHLMEKPKIPSAWMGQPRVPSPLRGEGREGVRPLVIPVLNKIDLVGHPPAADNVPLQLFSIPPCEVSALEGRGLRELERRLIKDFLPEIEKGPHRPIVFTQRQKGLLVEALNLASRFPKNMGDCFTVSEVLERLDTLERLLSNVIRGET